MKASIGVIAVAGVAAFAGTAMADPVFFGDVGAGLGARTCGNSNDDPCRIHFAWDADGHVGAHLDHWVVQADGQYERFESPDDAVDQVRSNLALGGHIAYLEHNWLLGGFGGAERMDVQHRDNWGGVYGAEGQYYFDHATVYAQVGYADIIERADSRFKGWFGRGVGRYFVNDDFMLQAELAYGYSDEYEDTGTNQWGEIVNWGFGATFRVADPLYMTVAYQGGSYTANTEDDGSENAVMFRLTYAFGGGSLLARDHDGEALDFPMLPGRAANWAQALD